MSLVSLPKELPDVLGPYLPVKVESRPFVTLTYAQSLDSRIAAKPGVQTKISHAETKTMTHFLRANHDAILVGIGTVLADDPKLNCRYPGASNKLRPVVLDPHGKWIYHESQLSQLCETGSGLAPYILIDNQVTPREADVQVLHDQGGKFVKLSLLQNRDNWKLILGKLKELDIHSVMVEGGAIVINELLTARDEKSSLVDSLIVTIGPTFLGNEGVEVSPSHLVDLTDIKWWTGIQDSVLCGKLKARQQ